MSPEELRARLRAGVAVPAHPLALQPDGRFDERHMRALTRYYLDAGADGLAVGVHTTQFAIREAGLLRPVLACVAGTVRDFAAAPPVLIAGICGDTPQAVAEAELARSLGYDAGLVSLAALRGRSEAEILAHCRQVGEALPLVGFYLQPAVGGIRLSRAFWRGFFALDAAVAVKIAPFDRYATLDVLEGLVEAGREREVALLTGNDDHIVLDLVVPHRLRRQDGSEVELRITGGLLGHWAVWTQRAVELHRRCLAAAGDAVPADLLALAAPVTAMNAALFDVANGFRGCIAGIQYVLWRQGLLASPRCLDPRETLSPGQAAEIDRVCKLWPELVDDAFVRDHLSRWLS